LYGQAYTVVRTLTSCRYHSCAFEDHLTGLRCIGQGRRQCACFDVRCSLFDAYPLAGTCGVRIPMASVFKTPQRKWKRHARKETWDKKHASARNPISTPTSMPRPGSMMRRRPWTCHRLPLKWSSRATLLGTLGCVSSLPTPEVDAGSYVVRCGRDRQVT
jgi:hypothetical protein